MKQVKRFLSLFLSVAMVVTGVNLGTLMPVQAAEVKSEKYYRELAGKFYGHRTDTSEASKVGTPNGQITAKIDLSTTQTGSVNQAPFTSDTAGGSTDGCGGQRNGCIVFTLPDTLEVTEDNLNKAEVSFKVTSLSNSGDRQWNRIALYPTANSDTVDADDEKTYEALSYSEPPIWSEEKVTTNNTGAGMLKVGGTVHFDVKSVVLSAIQDHKKNLVLRVQVPRAGIEFNEIKLMIDATTATTAIVKYVDGQGKQLQESKTVDVLVGSKYTYEVSDAEKKIKTNDNKYYGYNAQKSTLEIAEIKNVSPDQPGSGISPDQAAAVNVITLVYDEITIVEQSGALALTTSVGIVPELPEKVSAKFSDDSVVEAEAEWDAEFKQASKYQTAGATVQATGKFKGTNVAVTATVTVRDIDSLLLAKYTFDEENADGKFDDVSSSNKSAAEKVNTVNVIDGLSGKAVAIPGKAQNAGSIKLPEDLLVKDGAVQDDFSISMFLRQDENTAGSNAFAVLLHADQLYEPWSNTNNRRNHICLFNMANGQDKGLWAEYNNKAATDRQLNASTSTSTTVGEWTHIALVTKGSTNEAWLYVNGKQYAYANNIDVHASDLAGRYNYLGKTTWGGKDVDYAGAYDEFAVYGTALSASEVKGLCDDTLYKAQIEKEKEALQIKSAVEGVEYNKDNVTANLVLPTETVGIGTTIEWETSDDQVIKTDGTVIRPFGGEPDATVKLTATIKAGEYTDTKEFTLKVKAITGMNYAGLDYAINDATAKYKKAVDLGIYRAGSLKIWKDAIDAAQAVREKPESEITAAEIRQAASTLEEAITEDVLVLKNLEELNENLAAWYPLDADAKDASGKRIHATSANVTFSRENGATFKGQGNTQNCVEIPNIVQLPKEALDKLNVTDQMTFSFWTKFAANRNVFGIGSVVNTTGGASKHFYVNSALNAFMTDNGWASGAHKGFENVSITQNAWHHITAVLDGKEFTLYIDKKKIGKVDTDVTMTEAWDYDDGASRYLYIGNCAYGHNGDADLNGSVKDFRIYNAALAQEQVTEAYNYKDEVLPMKYAKEDLVTNMTGVKADYDGNLIVTNATVGEGSKITLPTTSYGNATVTWESDNEAITLTAGTGAVTGTVAVPALNAPEATGKLKATITLGGKKETKEFDCAVYSINTQINVTEMETLIDGLKEFDENDYTAKSWAKFDEALTAAKAQAAKPIDQTAFNTAKSNLETAKTGLVNIAALKTRVVSLEKGLAAMSDEDKELYTKPSWAALEQKLAAAKTAMNAESDATQEQINGVLSGLPAKVADEEKGLARRGDKTALNNLVSEAEAVKANKADYKDANWDAFETALDKAKEDQTADFNKAEVDAAVTALKQAMVKLEPKDEMAIDKAALTAAIEEADAEAKSLKKAHYTTDTWNAYQDALSAYKAIADKPYATKKDAEKAAKDLADAYAGLRPTGAHVPSEQAKADLKTDSANAAEEAKNMVQGNYTKESWARYQTALAALTKLAANVDSATAEKITAVTAEFKAAKAALVDKSKLDKAIKDYASLKAANYTTVTWNAFQTALDAAKRISAKDNATQKEVDDVLTELKTKKNALKPASKVVKVSKIKITADYSKVAPGKKATLKAGITPNNATNKEVTWSIDAKSQKGKYATINSKTGVLTTNKKGAGKNVTVTATAKDGSGAKKTFKVKIMKGGVKKISLKAKSKKVKVKKKLTIKATVTATTKKTKDANTKLTWKSSNKNVATVSSKGVVTGKKAGKVTITATATDGTKKSAKIKLTVVKK